MILSSVVLGVAVLRTNPLGYGGRILGLLVVVLPTTVVLGFVAPEWAHPAYVETTIPRCRAARRNGGSHPPPAERRHGARKL
jgi:hypothetical protein